MKKISKSQTIPFPCQTPLRRCPDPLSAQRRAASGLHAGPSRRRMVFQPDLPASRRCHLRADRARAIFPGGNRALSADSRISAFCGVHHPPDHQKRKRRSAAALLAVRNPSGGFPACLLLHARRRDQLPQGLLCGNGRDFR